MTQKMHFNEISAAEVDSAMKVHTALGPGLLESSVNPKASTAKQAS
jgi:hypothetical protein